VITSTTSPGTIPPSSVDAPDLLAARVDVWVWALRHRDDLSVVVRDMCLAAGYSLPIGWAAP
jgi:hypothetical protein